MKPKPGVGSVNEVTGNSLGGVKVNRLLVGVQDDQARSVIRARLAELNLPDDAFSIAIVQLRDAVIRRD